MLRAAASPPRVSTLVLLTALSVLSLNMFLPSLPKIAETFAADYALANLSIAGYLGITALVQLIVGPLSDRFGRRPVLLAALAIFIAASTGCLLATSIWSFLAFRMLQGAIISGWVLSLAVIRDTSAEHEAASLIGYVTMAMAVAPMLGPMAGGALEELFGWRSNFIVFIGLGAVVLTLAWLDLGETNKHPSETFGKQFQAYPELFRSRRFWGYVVCMASSTGAFYSFLAGSPLVAETILAVSPATLGFYMGTITAGFMFGSFLSGRYAGRHKLTTMMIAGRIVACGGPVIGFVLYQAGYVHPMSLFGATVLVGVGNGLTMPACNAGILSVRRGLSGSAAGLAGAVQIGGGAVLSWVTGAVMTETDAVHGFLGMIGLCTVTGLLAALYVRRVDKREERERQMTPA